MLGWANKRNVEMRIAQGEAHRVLGPDERARQVPRETLKLCLDEAGLDRGIENLKTALDYAPSMVNGMMRRKGYSASQRAPGYNSSRGSTT